MRTIHLHGYLKEKFGEKFTFDVETPQMAMRALFSQLKGFDEAIRPGRFVIIFGSEQKGYSIDAEEMKIKFGRKKQLHIVPYVEGSGGRAGGIVKIVLGVALIATGVGGAFVAAGLGGGSLAASAGAAAGAFAMGLNTSAFLGFSWGSIAAVGIGLAALGTSSLLTPRTDLSAGAYEGQENADQRPSFLFSGPRNQSTQGLPVPLVYGKIRTGSIVVSSGITTESVG